MIGIYKITNKLNNKAYIGQSKHIEQRWKEHQQLSRKSLIHKAIEKYGINNFTFEILEECSVDELDEREIYWIKVYNTFENGYNLTRGGNSGFSYNIETVYQEYLKTNSMKQTAKNIGCHETTVRNILRVYGINKSEIQQEKIVEQIDPITLEKINTFKCLQDAADSVGVCKSAISQAITGKHKSAGGYIWREQGDTRPLESIQVKSIRKVAQYDLEGNYIQTFDSMADAAASLNKDRKNGGSQICSVCKGNRITAYGYKWKYVNG